MRSQTSHRLPGLVLLLALLPRPSLQSDEFLSNATTADQLDIASIAPDILFVTPADNLTYDSWRKDIVAQGFRPLIVLCQYVVSWLVPFLLVFGVIGTSICLAGLLRRKSTQPEIQHWFVALSIADIYVLVFCLSDLYIQLLKIIFHRHPRLSAALSISNSSNPALVCYSKNVLLYFGLLVSTWIQVGISVLRVLSTRVPFTWRVYLTRRNSIVALAATVASCLIITLLMILLNYHIAQVKDRFGNVVPFCALKSGNTFFYLSLSLKVLLPLLFLLSSSLCIIRSLREFARTFSKDLSSDILALGARIDLPNGDTGKSGMPNGPDEPDEPARSSSSHSHSHRTSGTPPRTSHAGLLGPEGRRKGGSSGHHKRLIQRRISYILLGMNASFLVFTLPFEVWKIYDAYFRPHPADLMSTNDTVRSLALLREEASYRSLDRALNILVYVNNATNWIFYFILGKQFRASISRAMMRAPLLARCRRLLPCPRTGPGTSCCFCLCCGPRGPCRRRHHHQHRAPGPDSDQLQLHVYNHRASHGLGAGAGPKAGQHRCVPIYVPIHRAGKKPEPEVGQEQQQERARRARAASAPRVIRYENELHFIFDLGH